MYKIILIALFLTGCSTTQPFSQASDNAWFLERNGTDASPMYCMANKTDKGFFPICKVAKKFDTAQ